MLNAQEMSVNVQAVSQDTPLTPRPESVFLRLSAPTVRNYSKVAALPSVKLATTSTRASASTEAALMDMFPTISQVAFDQLLQAQQDPTATSTNTSRTDNVSAPA